MVEVEAKKVVLKNLAGEYLVPVTEPYVAVLKANNFYRDNPYVSAIGNILGFTEEQLDKFFETGDFEKLI